MNKTFIFGAFYLFLIYIITYYTQNFSGKRQFYGVSLNGEYFNNEEFKNLDRQFKKLSTIGFVTLLIIEFILVYLLKQIVIVLSFLMISYIIYHFAIYLYIHKKVKSLKEKLLAEGKNVEIEKTSMVFDTDFINEKENIIKKYSKLYLIPVILVLIAGVYVISNYDTMPNMIPIHWGISGEADRFIEKSFMNVLAMIFTIVSMSVFIFLASVYSLKARSKISIKNNDDKLIHLNYIKKFAIAFFILNTAIQLFSILMLITFVNASTISPIFVHIFLGLIIISSIYLIYIYGKLPSKSDKASYSVDDNDDLWLWGILYNNPNDPTVFINKRFGVGYTINIGTLKGKLLIALIFIIIGIAIFMI